MISRIFALIALRAFFFGAGRNVDHLCLQIEPFNEIDIVRHLQEQGVATQGKAAINFGAGGDGLSFYLADPDGNVIELKEAANGA